MIRSFGNRETEHLFKDLGSKQFQAIQKVARRKLYQVDQARGLRDLALPGNHLEALKGDRAGQYCIRINDQYRICFRWSEGDAHHVEIVDYH